jgi:hypothetical protein
MKSFVKLLAYVLAAVCLCLGVVSAQVVTATLVGKVTDQSGAVVQGVKVTIVNQATGLTRVVDTDPSGDYIASTLPAGAYRVTAQAKGFKEVAYSNVTLQVAQTPRLDIVLSVGDIAEKVEVTGESPLIQTDTSDVGLVVDNRQVTDLPLNGRKLLDLNLLSATVARISNYRNDPASPRSQNLGLANISFHGSSSDGNNFLIDGVQNQGMQTTHMNRRQISTTPAPALAGARR